MAVYRVTLLLCACLACACPALDIAIPSNGTVFSASVQVPGLAASTVEPTPLGALDPLVASRTPHWRCRYEDGRLVEITRRDADGTLRPMLPPDKRTPTNGILFTYASADASRPAALVTPAGDTYALEYDDNGLVTGFICRTDPRARRTVWNRIAVSRRDDGRVERIAYWEDRRAVPDADGVHAREFSYDTNGYVTSVRCRNTEGEATGGCLGIARTQYLRGPQGEWHEITYFNASGARTTDWHGVSRYRMRFTLAAQIDQLELFCADEEAATNSLGAHTLVFQYDEAGNLIGTRGIGPGGEIVFDGPGLTPELFDRTWAHALINRSKAPLSVPVWQFMDYSDLARAFVRWYRVPAYRRSDYAVEQLRVLGEYLVQSRAGGLALAAAHHCRANGLDDQRWVKLAVMRDTQLPWPPGLAARTFAFDLLADVPTNAVLICADDEQHAVLEFDRVVRATRPDVTVLSYAGLTDTVYVDSVRACCVTSIWLPTINEIRDTVRRYATLTSAADGWPRTLAPMAGSAPFGVVRGREEVAAINAALLTEMVRRSSNRPVALTGAEFAPSLARMLVPRGAVSAVLTSAAPALTQADAERVLAFWRGVQAGVDEYADVADWRGVRLLHARNAAAQAHILAVHDRTNAAAALYRRAIDLCPDADEPYLAFASELFRREDYCGLTEILDEFASVMPAHPDIPGLRTMATQMCARAEVIRALEPRVAAGGPEFVSNCLRLAELHDLQGHTGEAMALAEQMLASPATNNVQALEWLTRFLSRCGRMQETEFCIARLTALEPDNFTYWISRAAMAYNRREPAYGNRYLRRAAKIDPERIRHVLVADGLLEELREVGQTNLYEELEQIIGPLE